MHILLGLCFFIQLQIIQKEDLKQLSDNLYLANLMNYEGLEAGAEGHLNAAADKFDHAQRLLPRNYEIRLNLQILSDHKNSIISGSQIKQLFQAALQIKKQKYEQADNLLTYLANELPEYIPLFFYQGINSFNLKNFSVGIKILSRALISQPSDPYLFFLRARLNHAGCDLFDAITDYSSAIEIDCTYSEAFWGRGLVWRELHDLNRTIVDFEAALRLNPLYSHLLEESLQIFEVYNNRGIQRLQAGKNYQAIRDFKRAISINNLFPEPFINIATAYRNLHEYDVALHYYEKVVRLDSLNANVYLNRGILYKELKKYKLAIQDFQKSISINPYKSEAYHHLGEIYFTRQNYDKAILFFEKVKNSDTNNIWSLYWLGLSYDNIKKWDKAIESYQKFVDNASEEYYEHRLKAAERIRKLKNWIVKNKLNIQ